VDRRGEASLHAELVRQHLWHWPQTVVGLAGDREAVRYPHSRRQLAAELAERGVLAADQREVFESDVSGSMS
jgi:hypothetical protein